jgi:hypothetical protein
VRWLSLAARVVKGRRTQLEWRDSEGMTRLEQPDVLAPDVIMVRVVDPVEHIDWNFTIGKDVDKTAIKRPRDIQRQTDRLRARL